MAAPGSKGPAPAVQSRKDFHDHYLQFAQLGRISHHECHKAMRSLFPWLQAVQCKKLRQAAIPEDTVLLNSGAVIATLLARVTKPELDLVGVTTIFMVLNGLYRVIPVYVMPEPPKMTPGEWTDVGLLIKTFREIMEQYVKAMPEVLTTVCSVLTQAERALKNADMQRKLLGACQTSYGALLSLCVAKVNMNELVPAVLSMLLDLQIVGLFEMYLPAEDFKNGFVAVETLGVLAVQTLLKRQPAQALDLLTQFVAGSTEHAAKMAAGKPPVMVGFRQILWAWAVQSARQLAAAITAFNFVQTSDGMGILAPGRDEGTAMDLVDAVVSVVDGPGGGADFVRKLTLRLADQPKFDPFLRFLASSMMHRPAEAQGFAGLIGALLPLEVPRQFEHLNTLRRKLGGAFLTSMKAVDKFLHDVGVEFPREVGPYLARVGNATRLAEALYAAAIYTALGAGVPKEKKEAFAPLQKTLQRLAVARLFTLGALLRLSGASFTNGSVVQIELNSMVDPTVGRAIVEGFNALNTFVPNDFAGYDVLLAGAATVAKGISLHVAAILEDVPLSLTLPERDFSAILPLADQALAVFKELQEGMGPLPDLSWNLGQKTATAALSEFWTHANQMRQQLIGQADPTTISACISDVKLEAVPFFLTFRGMPNMPDTRGLERLLSGIRYDDDPVDLLAKISALLDGLGRIGAQVMRPTCEDSELARLDLRDRIGLDLILRRMLEVFRQPTIANIAGCLPRAGPDDLPIVEANLKKVIEFRLWNKFDFTLEKIAAMSELELFACSLEIAAWLPLVAGTETSLVNELSIPLIMRTSPGDVYAATQRILQLLQYSVPLRVKTIGICEQLAAKAGSTATPRIAQVAKEHNITNLQKGPDQRTGDIFNCALFLGYAYATRVGEFNEGAADDYLRQLLQGGSVPRINGIVERAFRACVMSATARGDFDPALLINVLKLLKRLEEYNARPNEDSFRALTGAVAQLPTTFVAKNAMTMPWAQVVALCDPCILSDLVGARGELDQLIRSAFRTRKSGLWSDSDDEPEKEVEVPPEIIYEDIIEEEEVGEAEIIEDIERQVIEEEEEAEIIIESEQVKLARAIEHSRHAVKAIKALEDAAKSLEMPIVASRLQAFTVTAGALAKALPSEEAKAVIAQLRTVEEICGKVLLGQRAAAKGLADPIAWFKQLKLAIAGRSKTSPALSELSLLSANLNMLWSRVERDPSKETLRTGVPLRRQIAGDATEVIGKLRQMAKQIDGVLEKMKAIPHEKTLQQSIAQVGDSAQIFYLLVRSFPYDDDTLKAKTAAASRRLMSDVQGVMQQMPARGTAEDIALRDLYNDCLGKVQGLLDFSTAAVATSQRAKIEKVTEAQQKAAMTRLEAEAACYKHRWILEQARGEKARLDALAEAEGG